MKFSYKDREKIDPKTKKEIELELDNLVEKYFFLNEQDEVHIEIEKLKNSSWKLKLDWWITKIGKKIICSTSDANIHKTIHKIKEKLVSQLEKTKVKKKSF